MITTSPLKKKKKRSGDDISKSRVDVVNLYGCLGDDDDDDDDDD